MVCDGKAQPSKLTQNSSPVFLWCGSPWFRIIMNIKYVSGASVGPAGGTDYQTSRVNFFDKSCYAFSIVLPPALIKRDPHYNRGMIEFCLNHSLQFKPELCVGLRIFLYIRHIT